VVSVVVILTIARASIRPGVLAVGTSRAWALLLITVSLILLVLVAIGKDLVLVVVIIFIFALLRRPLYLEILLRLGLLCLDRGGLAVVRVLALPAPFGYRGDQLVLFVDPVLQGRIPVVLDRVVRSILAGKGKASESRVK